MSAKDAFSRKAVDISTRAELDQREGQRAKPVLERHLRPGGISGAVTRQRVDAANESRVKHLHGRLDNAQARLKHGHGNAQVKGHAKRDFDRGR